MTNGLPEQEQRNLRLKVAAYITQGDRLLLFRHTRHPEAGIQVPAGSIQPGETPEQAVLREAREESSLEKLRLRALLGVRDFNLLINGKMEIHRRYFFHLEYFGEPAETWLSYEEFPPDSSHGPIEFEFFWARLPDGIPSLAGEQDALLPELQASFLTQFIVNVEAAILHEGRYLIIQRGEQETHAAGALTLPGGKVEKAGEAGQILETTLRREILEEVGLEIQEPPVYLESNSFFADDREPVIDIVFLCRYQPAEPVAEPRIADPGEVAAIHWMRADQIFQNPKIPPWTRQSIHLAEQKRAELDW